MSKKIGDIRRSQVVSTWGPGAIADFRVPDKTGAPVSGVMVGLEEWNQPGGKRDLAHKQVIYESRLQQQLKVSGFRLPPVGVEDGQPASDILPVVRFPSWLQCPECGRLDRAWNLGVESPGHPGRYCDRHEGRVWCFPARLIVACEKGHLADFPWQFWIGCSCENPELKVEQRGAGLVGRYVQCTRCNNENNLEGVFSRTALETRKYKCPAREPWLGVKPTGPCDSDTPPRVLQRGGSNVYWSVPASSLDIPPFSRRGLDVFQQYRQAIEDTIVTDGLEKAIQAIQFFNMTEKLETPQEILVSALNEWAAGLTEAKPSLKPGEYKQFVDSYADPKDEGEFKARGEPVPTLFTPLLSKVVLASRLREVRAQVAFTRIKPPSGPMSDPKIPRGRISRGRLNWFPAVEIRGEGIFIDFDKDALSGWEQRSIVRTRFQELADRLEAMDPPPAIPEHFSPRLVLLHSFSHALMRALSLECGYSSAALQERLYVSDEMAGVLVYTGSPDAEGTLGGLVRQGRMHRMRNTLRDALEHQQWCSSDPLCITNATSLSSPANQAACHGCLLTPETSCEYPMFNGFLDRAFLVGTPMDPELGYFGPLLVELG